MESNVISLDNVVSLAKSATWEKLSAYSGSKAASLAFASVAGLPIPAGFVLTSRAYLSFCNSANTVLSTALWDDIIPALRKLEETTKRKYGGENPLFLGVSGISPITGAVCVGLNDYTVHLLEAKTSRAVAYDAYRRFIRSFGSLVYDIPESTFDDLQDKYLRSRNVAAINRCKAIDYVQISKLFKSVIVRGAGTCFPQDPIEQLKSAITASLAKFGVESSILYRSLQHETVPDGGAVLLTAFEFGGTDDKSAVGVFSTHNLQTGAGEASGYYLRSYFVEDVTEEYIPPSPISELSTSAEFKTISNGATSLAKTLKQPITVEFVLTAGKLVVVRVFPSKFAGFARFSALVAMVNSKALSKEDALSSLCPAELGSVLSPTLRSQPQSDFCSGRLGASGGASGTTSTSAQADQILLKRTIYPSDVKYLISAGGCVSGTGGDYSRSAYYARALAKPAAIGCKDLGVDLDKKLIQTKTASIAYGDAITVESGRVFLSTVNLRTRSEIDDANVLQVLSWIDEVRADKISILTSSATVADVKLSISAGADGVGMFSIDDLIRSELEPLIQFIETNDPSILEDLSARLSTILSDVLAAAASKIITVKLLDLSPTGFLPSPATLTEELAALRAKRDIQKTPSFDAEISRKESELTLAKRFREANPALSLRGSRLCILYPDIFSMQARAILNAARAARKRGATPQVKILVPAITDRAELAELDGPFKDALLETGEDATIGAVLDSARGCCLAGQIAELGKLLCIETDLLHASAYGYSPFVNAQAFPSNYVNAGLFGDAPYATIDLDGVGQLIKLCIDEATKAHSDVTITVCGSNCANRRSIDFCYGLGIKSVTCRPEMVPVARLCAAQAVLGHK
jgi:pyruvate,orthophosphate dikinase